MDKSVDKYRLAESSFLNALKCAPGFVKAKICLARVYLILGEKENARKQARAALELTADPAILNEAKTIMNALNASP